MGRMRSFLTGLTSTAVVVAPVVVPVLTRRPRALRGVARASVAVTAGLSLGHALQRPAKLRMSAQQWWWLSTRLYRPWYGRAGHFEGMALLALPALAVASRRGRPPVLLAWAAVLLANPVLFMTLVAPTNRATLASPDVAPAGAALLARRWELGHLMRAVCHGVALIAVLTEPGPNEGDQPEVQDRLWTLTPKTEPDR